MPSRRSPHVVVIAAGYLLGAILYGRLPAHIPPLMAFSGFGPVWLGRPMCAFLLPTASAATYVLLRSLGPAASEPRASWPGAAAAYDAVMLRIIVFLLGIHAMVLAGLLGMLRGSHWAAQIVPLLLGATMITIGNLLPQMKPNAAIGIRTSATLSNRTLWARTHRTAGYVVVVLGALTVVAGLAIPPPIGSEMTIAIAPAAVLGAAALLFFSKKRISI
ncbi:MAG TPA: SdpI family protein [Vicinamibacterales bacterium]|nr:SdpI family protein [Vicinamibacterales bacterium]